MKSVVVGIINFRSAADTASLVGDITHLRPDANLDVLVLDNSGEYLPINHESVLKSDSNIGFAAAVNVLLARARAQRAALWLLNPDCRVSRSGGEEFINQALRRESAADLHTSLIIDGTGRIASAGGKFDRRFGRRWHIGYGASPEIFDDAPEAWLVDWASGAHLLAPERTVQWASPFREDFFLYEEELEWQLRNNLTVLVHNVRPVTHIGSASASAVGGDLQLFFRARNQLKLLSLPSKPQASLWLVRWLYSFILRPLVRGDLASTLTALRGASTVFQRGDEAFERHRRQRSRDSIRAHRNHRQS